MRKIFYLIVFFLSLNSVMFAEPVDNFKKSDIAFGGYLNLNGKLNDFLKNNDSKVGNIFINARPTLSYFIFDNFSLSIIPTVTYNSYSYSNVVDNAYLKDEKNEFGYGFSIGATKYFVGSGNFIPALGFLGGIKGISGLTGLDKNKTYENKSVRLEWHIGTEIEGFYFLNDNFAIAISILTQIESDYKLKDDEGKNFEYSNGYKHNENIDLTTVFNIGFRYFIPNESKFIIKK